jgi:uncharacterized repeat protein (TIGR01451 family)
MMTYRASGRYLFGWFIVALAALAQAPPLHGDGDPNCPTCFEKGPLALHNVPALEAPVAVVPMTVMEDVPAPMVRLKIRVPACAEVGKELEYRIKVENASPADAHNVIVRMNLPASVKVLQASPQIHARDPELQWNLGTMPGHGCHDIVVKIVPVGLADIKSCARVTFEHGQCVTTKVMAFAPEGSADGKTPPGVFPGGPFDPGKGPGAVGDGPRAAFDVRVYGPTDAVVDQKARYKITIFNKTNQPIYNAGAELFWDNALEEAEPNPEIFMEPITRLRAWPKKLIDMIPAGESRSLDLVLRTKAEGRFCVKAIASAASTPKGIGDLKAEDQVCTVFRRGIMGVTLEMIDRDDPILKNGQTSYPIMVRNQGKDPITNLQIKARVPDILELDPAQVRGPGRFRSGVENREMWVYYEPVATLNPGETQVFEIGVKGKGLVGDARFHVEMTADQLDKDARGGVQRWIIEEESTTIVPDEETLIRIRDISRKTRDRRIPGTVTSGH